ncbi:MAG: type II secretion system GspH family protein [Synergistaceae bacterium]|jgi:prepilin-type N-terminal cleavage/methylation domain-containing protein|nr:type II secretion system GspH family protein [Synergistaceae bacterium]
MKTSGFTMIETLVAVLILSLVVTASLTLVSLAERTLAGVRERERLLDSASVIHLETASAPLSVFGTSGDIEWAVEEKTVAPDIEGDIAAAALNFSGEETIRGFESAGNRTRKWNELTVKRNDKSVMLFLPPPAVKTTSDDQE